jgi:ADP-ribose pyrophosphatase
LSDPFEDELEHLEVESSEVVFEGRIQSMVRETFGYNGEPLMREFVRHPGAVAVLAMDADEQVLTIKQYRHPIRSREWEIPAGLLDVVGEPLLAAAKRELAEEADLEAREWVVLADLATSPGGSNELVRVYLARGLTTLPEAFKREAEEVDIELRWSPLDALVEAVVEGRVRNSLLVVGALAAFAARARGWRGLRADETS